MASTHSQNGANGKLFFADQSSSTTATQYKKGTLDRSQLAPSPFTQFHTWFKHAQSPVQSSPPVNKTSDQPDATSTATSPPHESLVYQPETCCLSTAHLPSGRVSSRFVYLKELDSRGFVVYSNWATSRKALDVRSNPYASLAFWWREIERQVRVEGRCERLSSEESQVYWDTRGRGSRMGGWASEQSAVLPEGRGDADSGERTGSAAEEVSEQRKIVSGAKGEDGEELKGREILEKRVGDVKKRFEGQDRVPVPDFWGGMRIVPEMVEFWQGRDSRLHDRFRYTKTEGGGWNIERLSP